MKSFKLTALSMAIFAVCSPAYAIDIDDLDDITIQVVDTIDDEGAHLLELPTFIRPETSKNVEYFSKDDASDNEHAEDRADEQNDSGEDASDDGSDDAVDESEEVADEADDVADEADDAADEADDVADEAEDTADEVDESEDALDEVEEDLS